MTPKRNLVAAWMVAASLAGASALAQGSTIYETDFESAGDPSGVSFTLGNLNSQGSWQVQEGTANVVNSPLAAASGSQYVAQGAGSRISRAVASASQRVIVRGHYFGNGISVLQDPPSAETDPMAAVLGFRALNASSFTVAAWDGNLNQYVEGDGPPAFPNNQWHKIIVSLNFNNHTYSIAVDNQPLLQGVAFHSDTLSSISEFLAASETGANVDRMGFFASSGDFDGDGLDDDAEMALGTDPTLTDTDGDGWADGFEFQFGSDPTDIDSTPVSHLVAFLNGLVPSNEIAMDMADHNTDGVVDAADVRSLQAD